MKIQIRTTLILRETNEVTDGLAKVGHHLNGHTVIYEDPPQEICNILE